MSDPDNKTPKRISLTVWMRIESACSEFEDALKKGESPRVESYLKGREEIERRQLLLNLLLLEFDYTTEPLKKLEQNFIKRFPEDQGIVTLALNKHQEKYAEQQDSVHFSEATYPTHEEHSEESSKIPRHLRYIEDYKLISLLGTGGMGVVYRAQHRVTMEDFALKMLKTGEHSTEAQVDRFLLEAKAAAKLDHPHIVPIYETGYRNGVPYFVMDYIDGNNLEEIRQQKQMSQMEAVQVVKQAAEAIQFAHDADIIHRDIKPSNLLIDNTGHVWVTDFGLARILSEDNDRLTQSNQLLGTPGFMPPEQALGQRAAIGKRSDVYSLGAVLYFLLTGRPPFQGETLLETVNLVVDSDPAPPRSLDPQIQPGLELVCLKCLQKHPQDRYSGATALASELDRWQSGRPLFVELGDSSEEVHEASFSTVALSAILLTVFSMILIIFMIRGGEEPTRPVRPQFSQNQEEPDDSTVSNRFQWKYREGQQTPGATEEPKVPDSLIRNAGKPGLTVPPPGPPPPDGPEPPEEIAILPLEAPGVHGQIELPIAPPTGSYPWSVVPSHARAVAVVPNIERFSDRMDTFAREMGVSAPRILAEAKKYSKLHQGLREDGALIWTWGEKKSINNSFVFYIPSTDHDLLLKKFLKSKPKPPADPYPLLIFERKQHATTSIPGYSLFSRTSRDSLDWLTDCKRGTGRGGLTTTLGAMNDYLIRQDIGFLVTDQGVQEGVTPELPFHDGREFLLQPMIDIAESMASGFGVEQMASGLRVEHLAGGTELIPGRGIRASVAATYLPTSETGQWAAKMFYRRNELLAELPLEKSSVVLLASSCEDWNDQIRTSIMSEIEPYCDPNLWSQMDPHEFQAFSLALHPFPQQPAVLKKLVPKQKIDLSHPLHLQVKVKDANLAYQVCRSVLLNSREMLEKQSTIQMRMGETQLGTRDVFEFDLLDLNRTFSLNLPHEYNFHLTLSVLDQETLLIQGGGMPRLKQILAMLAGKNRLVEDPRIRESAAFAGNGQQMLLVDIHALATSLASLYTAPDQQEEEMDEMIANIIDPFQQANPLCLGTLWESDHMEARFGVPLNLLPAIGEHWDYVQRGVNWLFE